MTRLLKEALILRRSKMTSAQRKASEISRFRAKFPVKIERQFANLLKEALIQLTTPMIKWIESNKYAWQKEIRSDGIQGRFELEAEKEQKQTEAAIFLILSFDMTKEVELLIEEFKSFQLNELDKFIQSRLQKPLPYTEAWMGDVSKATLAEVETRLTDTMLEFYDQVRAFTVDGIRKALQFDELVSGIRNIAKNITEKRSAFIARDLSGKVNADITRNVHLNILGIKTYTWQTMADERVRGRPEGLYPKAMPSHWDLENKVCKWEDASVYSIDLGITFIPKTERMPKLHPGQDWQCRCVAAPFDLDAIRKIDKDIELKRRATLG